MKEQEFEQELEQMQKEALHNLVSAVITDVMAWNPEADIDVKTIYKNNVKLTGISCRLPGQQMTPVIYVDDAAQAITEGTVSPEKAKEMITTQIQDAVTQIKSLPFGDTNNLFNTENVKEKLFAAVINAERNSEMLSEVPHVRIEDLAVIAQLRILDDGNDYVFVQIQNDHCGPLQMTPEEIISAAIENSTMETYHVKDLFSILGPMYVQNEGEDVSLKVVSNENLHYGAAGLFINPALRESVYNQVEGPYYIIPSSVHECLVLPKNDAINPEELKALIADVNANVVTPTERLSDSLYQVNENLHLTMVSADKITPTMKTPKLTM